MKRVQVRSIVLHMVLAGGAIIVLLPLFWMLVTGVKQPGQALKFQFWPPTEVEGPEKVLSVPPKGLANLTLEWNQKDYPDIPSVRQITVAGEFNDWDNGRDRLLKERDVWTVRLTNLKPGTYHYKFIVNGTTEVMDNANPRKDKTSSLIDVTEGDNFNKSPTDSSFIKDGKIYFKISYPDVKGVKGVLKDQDDKETSVKLEKITGEVWSGSSPVQGERVRYHFVFDQSFVQGISDIYTFSNFREVITNKDFPFGLFFINSLLVAFGSAFITALICTMGGYAFAKKEFFLRDQIFILLLGTMMIPGMIFMVPQFAIVNKLGWINTYQGMIVPHLANIFGLFLLRQYILTIPNSLFEAARIDGAGELAVFKIIIIPLSLPIIITLFLLTFVGQWSNFLWQLIVNTPDSPYRTLPVGLALFKGQYGIDWELMMAGACFSIIPIAILFLVAQRFFIEGMTGGAVKG